MAQDGGKIGEDLGFKKLDLPPCTSASEVFRCQVCAGPGSTLPVGDNDQERRYCHPSQRVMARNNMSSPPGKLKSQVQGSLCQGRTGQAVISQVHHVLK